MSFSNIRFYKASELGADPSVAVNWVVDGLVARGSIDDLVAKVKAGKTTFLLYLSRSVLEGEEFLGCKTIKMSVVYLTEQPKPSFRDALDRVGLLGRQDFHVLFWQDTLGFQWPEVAKAATRLAILEDALLIVDTLPQFARIPGDGENVAGEALRAMEPLQKAASLDIPVIIGTARAQSWR